MTPEETLAAARQALTDLAHGIEDEPELATAPAEIEAALTLLSTLLTPPDDEREREIAAGASGDCRCDGDGACRYHRETNVADDHRYLLSRLAALRARVVEVEGERNLAIDSENANSRDLEAARARAESAEQERDTLRREVEGMRGARANAEVERNAAIRLRDHLGERRADPACSTCGGSGCAPDGSTCDCYGWHPKGIDNLRDELEAHMEDTRDARAQALDDAVAACRDVVEAARRGVYDNGHAPAANAAAACVGAIRHLPGWGVRNDAIRDVLAEREKQRKQWGDDHDDEHVYGALPIAAASLAVDGTDARVVHPDGDPHENFDPWGLVARYGYCGLSPNRRHALVIAAALLVAEIEREDREAEREDRTATTTPGAPNAD